MTFELSAQHASLRDRARAFAQPLMTRAAEFDRAGSVPDEVTREIAYVPTADPLGMVLALEETAAASAAVAALALATPGGAPLKLTGLRGARQIESSSRAHLALAAIALGIGSAATNAALGELRRTTAAGGAEIEKPHWAVADAATDLEAARLLTYKAAQTSSDADIALARATATAAAARAVDVAVRIVGAQAVEEGSSIERLARDVRALSVLVGTEEEQRSIAAEGLLPQVR